MLHAVEEKGRHGAAQSLHWEGWTNTLDLHAVQRSGRQPSWGGTACCTAALQLPADQACGCLRPTMNSNSVPQPSASAGYCPWLGQTLAASPGAPPTSAPAPPLPRMACHGSGARWGRGLSGPLPIPPVSSPCPGSEKLNCNPHRERQASDTGEQLAAHLVGRFQGNIALFQDSRCVSITLASVAARA